MEWALKALLDGLRSDPPDPESCRLVADLLDPAAPRQRFRLELKRSRGNFNQNDVAIDRMLEFEEILQQFNGDEGEAVKQAALSREDGGLGVSETTARKYLKAYREIIEAWEP